MDKRLSPFENCIAEAFLRADATNKAKLEKAFSELKEG